MGIIYRKRDPRKSKKCGEKYMTGNEHKKWR
jgi:hypothetical protein